MTRKGVIMGEVRKLRRENVISDLVELSNSIKKELSAETICMASTPDSKVVCLWCEKYYFRVKSYVSLSIMLTQVGSNQEAIIVGSGGGYEWMDLFGRCDESIVKKACKVFEKYGFQ